MSSNFGFNTTAKEVIDVFSSSITGKTIVLTGPTPTSLGALAIERLASHPTNKPASIILLGRSEEKTKPLITKLNALSPATLIKFISLDLTSFTSIRSAAQSIIDLSVKIDILINNAGVMALQTFTPTIEGIESQFAINHLGHFLLTNTLLSSSPSVFANRARIISLSSEGHALGPVQLPTETPLTKTSGLAAVNFGSNGQNYNPWQAYGQSKSANILFTISLSRKLAHRNIQTFSLHPGNIFGTGLTENLGENPDWEAIMKPFDDVGRKQPGMKTLEEGLSTILVAALDQDLVVHSGSYLNDCKVDRPMLWASDVGNSEKLWEVSEVLVGEKFEF